MPQASWPHREGRPQAAPVQGDRFASSRRRNGSPAAAAGRADPAGWSTPLDVIAKTVQALEEVDERSRQVEEEARDALAAAEHRVQAAEARAAALEAQLRSAEARAAEAEHALRTASARPHKDPQTWPAHASQPSVNPGREESRGWAAHSSKPFGNPWREGSQGWATDLNTALLVLLLGLLVLGPDGLVRWLQGGLMALTGFVLLGTIAWALCGSWAHLARSVERAVGAPVLAPLFARFGQGSPDRQARAATQAGQSLVHAVQFGLLLQGLVLAILYGMPAIRSAGIL
jgi:DNA-binding protein H-NS